MNTTPCHCEEPFHSGRTAKQYRWRDDAVNESKNIGGVK
jgi:hypothetical protein